MVFVFGDRLDHVGLSLALQNSTDLILFAFRTNLKLWWECCSLSKACWTIWMDECVEFDKQYRNYISHVQMGATVGCGRCYIVDLNDEQDWTQNWTLWYSLWQGENTDHNHDQKRHQNPSFCVCFLYNRIYCILSDQTQPKPGGSLFCTTRLMVGRCNRSVCRHWGDVSGL